MQWQHRRFDELDVHQLYKILALRQQVFVVEQTCAFLDLDGADQHSIHITADDQSGLAAYARVVPPGVKHTQRSIGRVVTAPRVRGTRLGERLMIRSVQYCLDTYGQIDLALGAQAHLQKFYAKVGFAPVGDIYMEDDIPHVEMIRRASLLPPNLLQLC